MPWNVQKMGGSRPYKIVKESTGKVVGSSMTKGDALASLRARYAAEEDPNKMGKGKFSKLRQYLGR